MQRPLEADWALAITAYNRIADELAEVTGQGQTIRIVLDDGSPTKAATDQSCSMQERLPAHRSVGSRSCSRKARGPPG
ncbi:hypothetical protein [Streptomyces sp. NPDC002640]